MMEGVLCKPNVSCVPSILYAYQCAMHTKVWFMHTKWGKKKIAIEVIFRKFWRFLLKEINFSFRISYFENKNHKNFLLRCHYIRFPHHHFSFFFLFPDNVLCIPLVCIKHLFMWVGIYAYQDLWGVGQILRFELFSQLCGGHSCENVYDSWKLNVIYALWVGVHVL